ncbi:MAG: hypothetical protein MUO85_07725 [candidate division Zixibacteria bacterium]|nr:hypothetical protein [candidate division Zixibacteria bacterium]
MNEPAQEPFYCKDYPWHIIILRWIILSIIFALGIYIIYQLNQMLAWLYILYSIFGLTLILPLSRCVYCYYHNRWCNTGWGKIAAYLFNKGDEGKYVSKYPYAILLYPLWLFPLLLGMILLVRYRNLISLVLLLAYILLLVIEKLILRFAACVKCHEKAFCPALPFRGNKVS